MKPKRLTLMVRLWLAITLVCYSLASYIIERNFGGDWANWNHALGAVTLTGYLILYYKVRREVLLTGFFQVLYFIGMLLSAALLSGGMYMFEVAEFGDQNGIYWMLMVYFVSGLEINGLGYRLGGLFHFQASVQKLSSIASKSLILLVTITTLIISSYVFIKYRGPVLSGVDRVTFWREFVPSYLSFLPTLVVQSFFFVAFYYLWSRRSGSKSWQPIVIFIAYVLVGLFVLGQKLSLFLLFITTWFVLLPGVFPSFIIKRSHIIVLLGVVGFLVASVLISYVLQDRDSNFALARIALQAQLLWSVFDDANAHDLLSGDWSCYFGCGQFVNGIDFISYKYLPFGTYKLYSDGGTTLSGFMPALSIMTIGVAASLLVHFAISFILGIIQNKIIFAVSEKNIIYSLMLYKVYLGISVIWFAAMTTAIPGLVAVLLLIGLYRLCFPVSTGNKRWTNVNGVSSA